MPKIIQGWKLPPLEIRAPVMAGRSIGSNACFLKRPVSDFPVSRCPNLRFAVLAMLSGSALLCSGAQAQSSVEDRLQRLEAEVGALQKENAELRSELGREDHANAVDVVPAGKEKSLSIGGMVQTQAEFGEKGDDRFTTGHDRIYIRRARLSVAATFPEHIDFRIDLESGAATLAETSGVRAQLLNAYVNWDRFDFATIKAGQFKTPFGFEQLIGDTHLPTIERSLAGDRLTLGRQVGAQLGGSLLDKRISYAIGLFDGTGPNSNANGNDQFLWAGEVSGAVWRGVLFGADTTWTLGAGAYTSHDLGLSNQAPEFGFDSVPGGGVDNVFTGSRAAGSLGSQLHLGRWDVMAEFLRTRYRPADRLPAASVQADGWYAQAGYFVVPAVLQAIGKYETFDPDLGLSGNSTSTWTAGLNWLIKGDDLKLQLNWLQTRTDGRPGQDDRLLLRMQVIF